MPTHAELVAKIGSTDANDRAAIDCGDALLPALDALIVDPNASNRRRMAASRVAHEIRVRAMAAPQAPCGTEPTDTEARAFLVAGGTVASDGFHAGHDPIKFVEELYTAGATRVHVEDASLIVAMPANPEARARLIAIYNSEVDLFDQDFGGEELEGDDLYVRDRGQATLTFWWD